MDESPKKFDKDILKKRDGAIKSIANWDDGITDPEIIAIKYRSLEEILAHYGIDLKKVKVLELGSGNEVFLNYMRSQGVDAIGVDAQPRGGGEHSQVARIEQLPFPDNSFGVIVSELNFDSGPYNQNQNLMMREIARVLNHGGIYYGSEPFKDTNIQAIDGFDKLPLSNPGLDIYKKS